MGNYRGLLEGFQAGTDMFQRAQQQADLRRQNSTQNELQRRKLEDVEIPQMNAEMNRANAMLPYYQASARHLNSQADLAESQIGVKSQPIFDQDPYGYTENAVQRLQEKKKDLMTKAAQAQSSGDTVGAETYHSLLQPYLDTEKKMSEHPQGALGFFSDVNHGFKKTAAVDAPTFKAGSDGNVTIQGTFDPNDPEKFKQIIGSVMPKSQPSGLADEFGNEPFLANKKANPMYVKPIDITKEREANDKAIELSQGQIGSLNSFVSADKNADWLTRAQGHLPFGKMLQSSYRQDLDSAAGKLAVNTLTSSGLPAAALRGQRIDLKLMDVAPSVDNTPEANKKIVDRQVSVLQAIKDYHQARNDWIDSGHRSFKGFEDQWQKYNESNPILDKDGNINPSKIGYRDWYAQQQGGGDVPQGTNQPTQPQDFPKMVSKPDGSQWQYMNGDPHQSTSWKRIK